nr:reductive dehalogenase [uncultured prokaryote]
MARDEDAGFKVDAARFRRFSQRDSVFSRSFWDPEVHSAKTGVFYETYRKPLKHFRRVDGFTQKDYAIRNASWYVSDIFGERFAAEDRREGFLDTFKVQRAAADEKKDVPSSAEMAVEIKRVAKALGADLVGVTAYDERWVYSHKYSAQTQNEKPNEIPEGLDNVIVIATNMDYELIQTVPSALSGTATGLGYGRDTIALLSIGQYIRNLGYRAVESLNDTALAVPYAIQAGLGEYGRHGLLITKESARACGSARSSRICRSPMTSQLRSASRSFVTFVSGAPTRAGESDPSRCAERPRAQPLELRRYYQVDRRRREVLRLLGWTEQRLLHLHPRLPL